MRRTMIRLAAGAAVLSLAASAAACSKTDDGQVEVQVPDVDVKVGRDTVRVPTPDLPRVDVGTRRDTISTPTIGTKRTEIRRPTAEVKRP